MSSSNSNLIVVGSDQVTPIDNPDGLFKIWALKEIFMGAGTPGRDRYVPRVDDRVIDTETNEWYYVVSIDQTTFVPTLKQCKSVPDETFSTADMLLGVGPGTQSDTYRLFIDKSVLPYTACVDARLKIAGSAANSAIVYRGSLLDGSATPISSVYDQSGNLLGDLIPLEKVAMPAANSLPELLQWFVPNTPVTNIAIKTVPVFHTNADLQDDEIVTVVVFSADGNVVSKRQLLVENTAFIRSTDTSIKYITSVTLESPFLSVSDKTLIQYPINVPLEGLMLTGVVTYSDGTQLKLPVDGSKFTIFGFNGFVATVVGQKFDLVLKYSLSPNEIIYGSGNVSNQVGGQFKTANYKAVTLKTDGSYSVKLFAYPVWINATVGYQLQWWLYTLDRTFVYNVTPYIRYDTNSTPFNPTAYGVQQNLAVNINLHDVSPTFANYINVQTITISLLAQGDARTTNWTIGFSPNQLPQFGIDNFAASVPLSQPGLIDGINAETKWQVNITSGCTSITNWLQRLYFNTLPLTDTSSEVAPPTPNMFALVINGKDVEFPISAWNTSLTVNGAVPDKSTLFVKFFLRLPTNDVSLSICGLPVYQS